MSFAFFDNSCFSSEIRSTTASIAELKSSTMMANKHTATINALSADDTFKVKLIGIRIILSSTICRNAASFKYAALKPLNEYSVALIILFKPVLPLKDE